MNIVYATQQLPETIKSTIFLAGPTPRTGADGHKTDESWRPLAIAYLEEIGYDGTVIVPEDVNGDWKHLYDDQIDWEVHMRSVADVIVFWVPRDMDTMPAFTTNVEFGEDYMTGRVVYGRPDSSPKNTYLDNRWRSTSHRDPHTALSSCLEEAVAMIGRGAIRSGGEREVPLKVWKTDSFQAWYSSLRMNGNRLDGFRVMHTYPETSKRPFSWIAHVDIWIESEQRNKPNEFVFSRPDVVSVVLLYEQAGTMSSTSMRTVLVKEFRSSVRNRDGLVVEPAGGSGESGENMDIVAIDELREEVGLEIDITRLKHVGSRQVAATLASYYSHAYSVKLTDEEFDMISRKADAGEILGANSDERITLEICDVDDLPDSLDWASVGVIRQST